jgi:hypothetical protein
MSAKVKKFRRRFGDPAATFELQNVRVARLIVENAEPGDRGLAVMWARMVLDRTGARGEPEQLTTLTAETKRQG